VHAHTLLSCLKQMRLGILRVCLNVILLQAAFITTDIIWHSLYIGRSKLRVPKLTEAQMKTGLLLILT